MNSVAFTLGPLTFYWYSIFVLLGIISAYFIIHMEFKRQKMSLDFLSDYFFYTIPIAIVGARIYYVAFEWDSYKNNLGEIFAVWNGGLAIHGGIIAGVLFTIYYTRKHKVDTLKIMDIAAPCLILGQALGRWGNFFNQEAFGSPVNVSVLKKMLVPQFVIDGMPAVTDKYGAVIKDMCYQPTFYYEFLICLLGFVVIMLIRRRKNIKIGEQSAVYFMIYGMSRFFIEAFREDSLMVGNFKVAQIVSIIMLIGGLTLYIRQHIYSQQLYNVIEEKKKNNRKKK